MSQGRLRRHSKIADGLPLSVEERSCSEHHRTDGSWLWADIDGAQPPARSAASRL